MNRARGGPLRLLKSLRGDGTLLWGRRGSRAVAYSIDLYGQGPLISGDGEVQGDLAELVGRAPPDVRLRLASGHEAPIVLRDIEPDSAALELAQPVTTPIE